METEMEIIIPTFINIHLFWIIEKRQILLQSAIDKYLRNTDLILLKNIEKFNEIFVTNINNVWVRVVIVFSQPKSDIYVCWLIDFAILHIAKQFYKLPSDLKDFPAIARQASLYNVVNVRLEFNVSENFVPVYNKTLSYDNGIRITSLQLIDKARRLFLLVRKKENSILFGDVICEINEGKQCLTKQLIESNCLAVDEEMFKLAQKEIETCKNNYFLNTKNWESGLVFKNQILKCDRDLFFNVEENSSPSEYFQNRTSLFEISDISFNNSNFTEDTNDLASEITIPTFINPFLFWIINKSHLLIRLKIEDCLKYEIKTKINYNEQFNKTDQIVVIKISNGKWVRAKIINVININGTGNIQNIFVCWLIDYGVLRTTSEIYQINKSDFFKCPPIAQKASLYNVVNLIEDVCIDEIKKKFVINHLKTLDEVESITNKILDILNNSNSINFIKQKQENEICYGDLFVNLQNEKVSLIEILIKQKLMEIDEVMFESVKKENLELIKTKYFNDSRNWQNKELISEDSSDLSSRFFNNNENTNPVEYFQRKFGSNSQIKNSKLINSRPNSSMSNNSDNYKIISTS